MPGTACGAAVGCIAGSACFAIALGGRANGGCVLGFTASAAFWEWPAPCNCLWRCVWALRTYIALLLTSVVFWANRAAHL